MPDLIAQGPHPHERWRRTLPDPSTQATLGRTSEPWAVSWDDRVSRRHASLRWNGKRLEVARLADARNAIFYKGRQQDQFAAAVGEHFVIGQTTFTLLDQRLNFSNINLPAFAEQTFSAHLLRQTKYKDANRRIEALGKLPDIIAGAASDEELCMRIVNLLLHGVPQAAVVAILRLHPDGQPRQQPTPVHTQTKDRLGHELDTHLEGNWKPGAKPMAHSNSESSASDNSQSSAIAGDLEVLHWDCRAVTGLEFTPSAGLVRSAIARSESVLHIWNRALQETSSFTQCENVEWAFCTPVVSEACRGWAIYVAGDFATAFVSVRGGDEEEDAAELQDDLKFTELTATTLGALRQVRALQRRHDSLRNFFAPVVLEAMADSDPDQVLAPRETEVSVLFCDLRGFSRQSEDAASRLLELLRRVSDALGVMTHHILANGGVVGDFHGDAAMGFWGWPLAGRSAEDACRTALAILKEFDTAGAQPDHPLANFRAGIGIASGPAVAGRIGTRDQVKVTVFGPVVNLASRLEGMTKQLQTSILIDEPTADWVRQHVSPERLRIRRVAKVLPFGMQTPLVVSELLPPAGDGCLLSDEHILAYEAALAHFQDGNWAEAFRLLHHVPAEDQVKDLLTVTIAQHRRVAPPNWMGVIELPSK